MKKARSSERAYKNKKQARFPVPVAYNLAEEGDSEIALRALHSSAKASSRFAETAHRLFSWRESTHRFESPRCCHKTKQARFPVPVAYNLAEEGD